MSINIGNLSIARFGQLFSQLDKKSNGGDFPLEVGEKVAERKLMSNTLKVLVEKEWKARKSHIVAGQDVFKESILPENKNREFQDIVYVDDLEKILFALSAIMPDPADPSFPNFLRSRNSGVIRSMQLLVRAHNKLHDTDLLIRESELLAKNEFKAGLPVRPGKLAEPIWTNIMYARNRRIASLSMEVPEFNKKSSELYSRLSDCLKLKGLDMNLVTVSETYSQIVKLLIPHNTEFTPEYYAARWYNVMLNRLNQSQSQLTDSFFAELNRKIINAKSVEDLTTVIDSI